MPGEPVDSATHRPGVAATLTCGFLSRAPARLVGLYRACVQSICYVKVLFPPLIFPTSVRASNDYEHLFFIDRETGATGGKVRCRSPSKGVAWGLTKGHSQDSGHLKTPGLQRREVGTINIYPALTGAPYLSVGRSTWGARGDHDSLAPTGLDSGTGVPRRAPGLGNGSCNPTLRSSQPLSGSPYLQVQPQGTTSKKPHVLPPTPPTVLHHCMSPLPGPPTLWSGVFI